MKPDPVAGFFLDAIWVPSAERRPVLQAALAVVTFGGLHRITEHDGRGQQDRPNGHTRDHDGDNGPVERENEAEDEHGDGDRNEQIADAIGE